MDLSFIEIDSAEGFEAAVGFIRAHDWPYHGSTGSLTPQALHEAWAAGTMRGFWLIVDGRRVGLLRVLDLDDIGDGSPVFDLRIAPTHQSRGLGRRAVRWMCRKLFNEYDELHRIEATTRVDNVAMRRVLESCGFTLEGRLRQTWPTADGAWQDTAIYGILRAEHTRADRREDTMEDDKSKDDVQGKDSAEASGETEELMVRHDRRMTELVDDDEEVVLMVRHNRPMADIELMVRHNRPKHGFDAQASETDADAELMVRHDRRLITEDVTEDDDDEIVLMVRHNRPMADFELMVRHNRPKHGFVAQDEQLMVRHDRRLVAEGDAEAELMVRHDRRLVTKDDAEARLMVRHDRRLVAADGDTEAELMVRHDRRLVTAEGDTEAELMVRHDRRLVAEDDDEYHLMVRHNRPFTDMELVLAVRHNRPMSEE